MNFQFGFWFGLENEHNIWAGFVGAILFAMVGLAGTWFFLQPAAAASQLSPMEFYWEFCFGNIFELKNLIAPVVGWIPGLWCYMIKMFLPHLLLLLWVNLAQRWTSQELFFAVSHR